MDEEKDKPIQLRLTPSQKQKLSDLADTMGLPKVQLIRWGVDALLAYVEQNGGKITLPLRFPSEAEVEGGKSGE